MLLTAPMPFTEALDAHQVKSILPTSGKSADLRALEGPVKRRALWSATVTAVPLLEKIRDGVSAILAGQADQATVRLGLVQVLREMGYTTDPESPGSIEDLGSLSRLNLIIETNVQTAQGFGWDLQGQQSDILDEWPAQELYRAFGPKDVKSQRDWAARWIKVGGQSFGGRMIALKNDPIWDRLGDSEIFPDGLDNPWPPFAFNSGMDVRDIARDEAVDLGLIDPDTEIFPRQVDLNDQLQATPEVRSADLRALMEAQGVGHFEGDTFVFDGKGGS